MPHCQDSQAGHTANDGVFVNVPLYRLYKAASFDFNNNG